MLNLTNLIIKIKVIILLIRNTKTKIVIIKISLIIEIILIIIISDKNLPNTGNLILNNNITIIIYDVIELVPQKLIAAVTERSLVNE